MTTADETVRLTVGQAIVRFLAAQQLEDDGECTELVAGMLGIFGHGNVAGIGQALLQNALDDGAADANRRLPYVLCRNEQAMVHTAVGYARHRRRRAFWACTASIGPGSTNMLTGAALATTNRIPVLLLPSGTFATRVAPPVLQELELPWAGDLTVNDAFRPLSKFYDDVQRPEQLPAALLGAMRVLTDPAETGAATINVPQDVQAQAFDWPAELFQQRRWHLARTPPEAGLVAAAVDAIQAARRPLIIAGGGIRYSGAEAELDEFATAAGVPVGETQAGKGSLLHGHPWLLGGIGSTGTSAATKAAAGADLVIGIGTRYSDFTTASRTLFADKAVRFLNINVCAFDAAKQAGLALTADARQTLQALSAELRRRPNPAVGSAGGPAGSPGAGTPSTDGDARGSAPAADRAAGITNDIADDVAAWDAQVDRVYHPPADVTGALADGLLTQGQVIAAVNEHSDPRDVVLCAAGSMPGDLHQLYRVRDHLGYHVEYAYSCMGYEIPAAIGVRLADPSRDVFAMVGDGGYLMMPTELVTAVQERVKIIVVLVQNTGFASIGNLSQSVGSQRFGTRYRARTDDGSLDGELLDTAAGIDLAANARSLGARVIEVTDAQAMVEAIGAAKAAPPDRPVVIHVRTDPLVPGLDNGAWWDVPVAEVATVESTVAARAAYDKHRQAQRPLVRPFG